MVEFLFAERSDGDLLARLANRNQTHDVLQCPSATRRIEPVYILDAAGAILDTDLTTSREPFAFLPCHARAGVLPVQPSKGWKFFKIREAHYFSKALP